MKTKIEKSRGLLQLLVLSGFLAFAGASTQAGPTNDWALWKTKQVIFAFDNAILVTVDGHPMPAFAPELFTDQTKLFLYCETDGKVYGVGTTAFNTGDREAVMCIEAKGTLGTRAGLPSLSFTLSGEGPSMVHGVQGRAILNAKFVQTGLVTNNLPPFETYCAEGDISGVVRQTHGPPIRFEDTIKVPLDNVIAIERRILRFDMVDVNGRNLAGHSHGTNNMFGKYEYHTVDLGATGTYNKNTGKLTIQARGAGDTQGEVRCTVTSQLQSAASGSPIDMLNAELKGKAYGQRLLWHGSGHVVEMKP